MKATLHAEIALAVVLLAGIPGCFANGYPQKAIRLIVPFPPGGGTDALARSVAQKLTERWTVPVVIDNRGGANGIVAAQLTAQSPPDGYTILLITAGHAINPSLYQKLPFDTLKSFAAVASVAYGAFALVVHPSVPANTVKELITLAKARSGSLNFASSGTGSPNHLAGELFKTMADIHITHVPYKGAGPALTAVVSGEADLAFGTLVSAPPLIKARKLKGLAVTTAKRSALMPELPTMSEAGMRTFDVSTWFGVMAPAGTPTAIVTELNSAIDDVLHMPDIQQRLASQGLDAASTTPAQFSEFVALEIKRWASVVQQSTATSR